MSKQKIVVGNTVSFPFAGSKVEGEVVSIMKLKEEWQAIITEVEAPHYIHRALIKSLTKINK